MADEATRFPTITAIPWLPAKDVLGGEASDFTPWLQQPESLEILGETLKLADLIAIATEHNVLGKRLDILARALDENGEEIPVCIENQYGTSDASHLGRLIAYLAQQERGRAIWIVEDAHDAFVAGVRFLNRTSTDEVGYYLVQVRFTSAPSAGFHVHFDVLAAPNDWERSARRGSATPRIVNASKVEYLEAIHEAVRPRLIQAGFPNMNTHPRGAYLWLSWPADLWLKEFSRRLDIRVTRDVAIVAVYIHLFATKDANLAAAEVVREHLGSDLEAALPPETRVDWDATGSGQRKAIKFELDGGGYLSGDVARTADWASKCCIAALEAFRSHPIRDLAVRVEQLSPGSTLASSEDTDEDDE